MAAYPASIGAIGEFQDMSLFFPIVIVKLIPQLSNLLNIKDKYSLHTLYILPLA